jgi:hypothetical protein
MINGPKQVPVVSEKQAIKAVGKLPTSFDGFIVATREAAYSSLHVPMLDSCVVIHMTRENAEFYAGCAGYFHGTPGLVRVKVTIEVVAD